jgi:two-component system chemotaxis sensor kinase CheA
MSNTPVDIKEEEFLKRLRAMFHIEATEHIAVLSSGLIELEKIPKDGNSRLLIETIFREVHSLKGAARSVNQIDIESVCQALESIFAVVKNDQILLTADQFDCIHKAVDLMSNTVSGEVSIAPNDQRVIISKLRSISKANNLENKDGMETTAPLDPTQQIIENGSEVLSDIDSGSEKQASEISVPIDRQTRKESTAIEPMGEKSIVSETVRIQTAKLDMLFLQSEQMIQSKIASVQRTVDLKNISNFVGSWKMELRKHETRRSMDARLHVKEILAWTKEMLDETEQNIGLVTRAIENDQRSLGRMIDDHVDAMKKVLMLPIATMIEVFPKLIRDLARSEGKEVELVMQGKEIEVDKRILEELKDPLIHLLRNCIDHGIKEPKKRLLHHKPPYGTIMLTFAVRDGRTLEIIISDDGEGINEESVLSAARKAGIVSTAASEKITVQESLDLIFHSGLSTSPIITDISGRGLGLAIVREKVEKLGGKVFVESEPKISTTFRLFLPLTLSTFRGVLVRTGDHLFFIPTDNVERVLRVNNESIKTVESRETMVIGQEIIRIVNLSDVLEIRDIGKKYLSKNNMHTPSTEFSQIIVLTHGTVRIGVRVDEIFDEQQILVKDLGQQLQRVRNISGAAVLGSGAVVPVLNISDVMRSAMVSTSMSQTPESGEQAPEKVYSVLAADDSITSRTLIKNILETAGYTVVTAVDGVDAATKALEGEFDLLVSDVDMPRMNGFELTAKIRKDKRLCELPIVLVTALDSKEDREHGIDVGANAYIVKSSFDQSNLLGVIKKLL